MRWVPFVLVALLGTPLPAAGQEPTNLIAFTRRDASPLDSLWTVAPDGSSPVRVASRAASWIRNDFAPTWSWDRSRIAFHSGSPRSAIWSVRPDGSDERQVTFPDGPYGDEQPSWSPSGTSIAFTHHFEDFANVFRQNLDGTGKQEMTRRRSGSFSPTWSPDGTTIAFRGNVGGVIHIFVVDEAGQRVTKVTNEAGNKLDLVWSPDSTRLAWAGCLRGCAGAFDIYILDIASKTVTTIAPRTRDVHPVWSPAGSRLAFVGRANGPRAIYVVDADGGNMRSLTPGVGADYAPAWSPDETRIAFISNRDGNRELYVMNADGTDQTRLTTTDEIEAEPAWGPGGASST